MIGHGVEGAAAPAALRRPRQRRSHAGYDRLLAAARAELATRDFDTIPIRDIAAAAGCSIGSFYYRFGDKETLFRVLVEDATARRIAAVRETIATVPMDQLAAALAKGALANQRASAGLLRSAVKKHLQGEGTWDPFSTMGQRIAHMFEARVAEHRGRPVTDAESKAIRLAFAWLYGLLIQNVLGLNVVDGLEDGAFEEEVMRTFAGTMARALRTDG